ncbi:hypothetical protein COTS27_01673 [Spirochaetota bacterium]|nr:hypothetical protein COTS27_01673 [Spirochaetota bacterium]
MLVIVSYFIIGLLLHACGKPDEVLVYLDSTPSHAKLFLDKKYIGITPVYTKVIEDNHYQITLKKTHHYTYQAHHKLDDENTFPLSPIEKELTLIITPRPEWVFLNNEPLFQTTDPTKNKSFTLTSNFPYGTHTLFAFKTGYPLLKKSLPIDEATPTERKLTFTAPPYQTSVLITSTPPGSDLLFENYFLGQTPLILRNLNSAHYDFTLRKNNYHSQPINFTLTKNEHKKLHITLTAYPTLNQVTFKGLPQQAIVTLQKIPETETSTSSKPTCADCTIQTLALSKDTSAHTHNDNYQLKTTLLAGTYRYKVLSATTYPSEGTFSITEGSDHEETVAVIKKFASTLTPIQTRSLNTLKVTTALLTADTLYLLLNEKGHKSSAPILLKHKITTLTTTPPNSSTLPLTEQSFKTLTPHYIKTLLNAAARNQPLPTLQSEQIRSFSYILPQFNNPVQTQFPNTLHLFDNSLHKIIHLDPFSLAPISKTSLLSCLNKTSTFTSTLPLITGQAAFLTSHPSTAPTSPNSQSTTTSSISHLNMLVTDLANEVITEFVWDAAYFNNDKTTPTKNPAGLIACRPFIKQSQPLHGKAIAVLKQTSTPHEHDEFVWIGEEYGTILKVYDRRGYFLEKVTLNMPLQKKFARPESSQLLYLFAVPPQTLIVIARHFINPQVASAKSSSSQANFISPLPAYEDFIYRYTIKTQPPL